MDAFWDSNWYGSKPNSSWGYFLWAFYTHSNANAPQWTRRAAFKIFSESESLDFSRRTNQISIIQATVLIKASQMEFLKELWAFLRVRKKLWLAPIIIVMLILGGLLVLAQGSVVAPFIYTLF